MAESDARIVLLMVVMPDSIRHLLITGSRIECGMTKIMKTKPKALILKADGINRDVELADAFVMAGGLADIVHVNELRLNKKLLKKYQMVALPGGFSYGDDVVSGKIHAVELTSFFSDTLQEFIDRKDTLMIGICNGFQALIRTGLLPFRTIGTMQATLINNAEGHFECRWIRMEIEKESKSVFMKDSSEIVTYPIAHGEGRFFCDDVTLAKVEKEKLVVFRYVDEKNTKTMNYPENPNGSLHSIAGITDPTGRILGLMPHPECFTRIEQHPNWRRGEVVKPQGLELFQNMVNYAKES